MPFPILLSVCVAFPVVALLFCVIREFKLALIFLGVGSLCIAWFVATLLNPPGVVGQAEYVVQATAGNPSIQYVVDGETFVNLNKALGGIIPKDARVRVTRYAESSLGVWWGPGPGGAWSVKYEVVPTGGGL